MEETEYRGSGFITFEDYIRFIRKYLSEFLLRKNMRWYIICAAALSIITVCSFYFLPAYSAQRISLIGWGLFLAVGIIFILLFFQKKTYRKTYESNKFFTEKVEYVITENEIRISSESSAEKLTKDKIYRILFDKDVVYIFIAENMAHILKQSYFADEAIFDEVKNFIRINYM
ncbi:hypothetical protein K7I13_05950 [Brucepastera parasyntrophica]|uniref:YcxB family protein n=1 Tax=Brucepastera parasyntrophica TaxID=2880008 RepID=UPI00210E17FA|nr:YcxB family protein [Brucepastera parasyntrophica]ULQ60806.1 hypothetical protein K7I13_05950 [Brucepastera parasyntrophica]